LIHKSLYPAAADNKRHLRIAAPSGLFSMWNKLKRLEIQVPNEHVEPILMACKQHMLLTREELADEVIREISAYVLVGARTQAARS
jgi:hypothetical protein